MSLVEFAKAELDLIGMTEDSDDEMNRDIRKHILDVLTVISSFGHSKLTIGYTMGIIDRLTSFKPLTPLTGDDSEWVEVAERNGGPLFQNKRCSTVFKNNGEAYNIDGRVFVEPNGATYTSRDSFVYITFPYVPTTEYVNVPASDTEQLELNL